MRLPALALALLLLALPACSSETAEADGLEVTAGFYPYAFLVERIGADDVTLTTLATAGAEPHDLELSPRQVASLGQADLVVYAEGFQPALDDALEQEAEDAAFDVNAVTPLLANGDPHVWLDPSRLARIGDALAQRLGELEPDKAEAFAQRAQELETQLTALDGELREGLQDCARREIVTSHDAFGYLADRYDLEQIAVTGLTPEEEPTPGRLAEVARLAEAKGVTTIFFEELVSPRTAESLAREVGAQAKVLTPLETAPDEGDYVSAMRANLDALRAALDCT